MSSTVWWVTAWTLESGCQGLNSDSAVYYLYGQRDFGQENNGSYFTGFFFFFKISFFLMWTIF